MRWITWLASRWRAQQTAWINVICRTRWSSTSWTHIAVTVRFRDHACLRVGIRISIPEKLFLCLRRTLIMWMFSASCCFCSIVLSLRWLLSILDLVLFVLLVRVRLECISRDVVICKKRTRSAYGNTHTHKNNCLAIFTYSCVCVQLPSVSLSFCLRSFR